MMEADCKGREEVITQLQLKDFHVIYRTRYRMR